MKFASSQKLFELSPGIAQKRQDIVFSPSTYLVMLSSRVTKSLLKKRISFAASLCSRGTRPLLLIGSEVSQQEPRRRRSNVCNARAPGQISGIIHTHKSLEFISACEDLPEGSETNEIHEKQFSGQCRFFCSSGSVESFRMVVEKRHGTFLLVFVFWLTRKTNGSTRDGSRLHQYGTKDASR